MDNEAVWPECPWTIHTSPIVLGVGAALTLGLGPVSSERIMDSTVMSIVIGLAVAVGIGIAMARQGKKNAKLAESIEPMLKERGPMTLPALAEALGMGGFYARGKVVLALNDLVMAKSIEVIPAPEGTPQLQKVNHIQYRWVA